MILSKAEGYRSRAAYKLIEINKKFRIFKPGITVIDLGASPGGWSQVAATLTNANNSNINKKKGRVIAIDLLTLDEIPGVTFLNVDFFKESTIQQINSIANYVNLIINDMATNTTGHKFTDYLKMTHLFNEVLNFTILKLAVGGNFISKLLHGNIQPEILQTVKNNFSKVKYFKPNASRKESSELYLIALNKK